MRTIILVFFTAFVLALAYMGYWWMQKPARPQAKAPGAEQRQQPLAPTANDSGKPYGAGKGAWVKRYDLETAQLISRFKAEDYQPRSDGWVVVKKPRAQFFMKDGRAISIEGDTGEIIMDDPGRRGSKGMPAGKAETPSRGRLHNVVIKLFHDIDVPEKQLEDEVTSSPEFAKNHIGLTIALENAAFNNESFKITSEAFKDRTTGRTVPSDQVPVVMRGVDYDFDGKGLTILWNERDRRLQYLEVAHGQKLVVHRPSQVMKSREAAPAATAHLDGAPVSLDWAGGLPFLPSFAAYYAEPVAAEAPAPQWSGVPYALPAHRPLPLALAAKNPAAAADAIPPATAPATTAPTGRRGRNAPVPKPKITPSTEPPLYLATFRDNVRVVQGADLDVSANVMAIQFLMQDQSEDEDKAATQPTTKPATQATTAPLDRAAEAAPPATNATTQPAVAATSPSTRSPKRAALDAAAAAAAAEAAKPKPAPATKPAVARRPRPTTRTATSRPGEPPETPITITWTGALTIKPLTAEPESPLRSGDAVVRLDGAPVKAVSTGSTIECGVLTYRTREQIMNLVPVGPDQPVVLRDAKGAIVRTALMDFDQANHKAVLGGKSEATFPQEDDNGKPGAPLTAKWTKSCTLYFEAPPEKPKAAPDAVQATAKLPGVATTAPVTGGVGTLMLSSATKPTTKPAAASPFAGSMNIDRATLEGDVAVDRPGQLKLRSQHLELAFDNTPRPGAQAGAAPKISVVAPAAPAAVVGDPAQAILVGRRDALAAELKKAQAEFQTVTGGEDLSARQSKLLATLDATDARLREIQKRLTEIAAGDPKATPEESKALTDELSARKTERQSLQDQATQLGRNMIRADELTKLAEATRVEHAKVERELGASGAKVASPVGVAGATTKPAPAFRSDLRQMIATGTVHCELTDSSKKTQVIDCQRLDLQTARTPDGKVYPRTIIADGGVHAVDPEQDLRAGRLAVTLRPSTRPTTVAGGGALVQPAPANPATAPVAKKPKADSADTAPVELESLLASTNVKVMGKDGTQAIADQLIVDNKDGKNVLKLLGQPTATLIDKKNKLTGPTIVVLPDDQRLDVFGAGSMTGVQDAKAPALPGAGPAAPAAPQPPAAAAAIAQPAPERPITVTWTQSLAADAKANTVDVLGGVVAVMKDADGATNTAKGNRVRMTLADAPPTTRPTDGKPGAVAAAAIEGASKSQKANPYGAMGAKTVRTISFNEAAEVSSVTLADNGNILRRTHLEAPTISYDLLGRSMNIPVPGRMIVEDHRAVAAAAPAPQPGVAPAPAKPAAPDGGDNRGTTAFLWPKSFTYDDATRVATMLGDGQNQVVIVFQDDKDKQYRLQADRVNAELEQLAAAPDAPKPPADKPAEQKVAMKRVTASGGLHFVGPGGADVLADQMEFDPRAQTLMARGDGRSRVTFTLPPNAGANQLDMIKFRISDYRILDSAGVQVRMAR
ncbi:MAG: hypothetical protein ACAI43_01910 [Phycisphaerae bacterium]